MRVDISSGPEKEQDLLLLDKSDRVKKKIYSTSVVNGTDPMFFSVNIAMSLDLS